MMIGFAPALRRAPLDTLAISARDRSIIAAAIRKLGPGARAGVDFHEAVRALREATEERIPAGRIYLLGATEQSPIIGSIVSGVGIVAGRRSDDVLIVRVGRDGRRTMLGSLSP